MNTVAYSKSAWLTLVLVLTFVAGWELYWRHEHYALSYNDDESLWASKRKLIYQSSPKRPVLIGSSRIKFDLDLDTWERITGAKPLQLSIPGTSPRPLLTDLGNDPNFNGTLLIDVTEGLFLAQRDHSRSGKPTNGLGLIPTGRFLNRSAFRLTGCWKPICYFWMI